MRTKLWYNRTTYPALSENFKLYQYKIWNNTKICTGYYR